MEKELKFNIGDGVSASEGPMKGIYGSVVFFDKGTSEYLVRFGEQQQLYFPEEKLSIWETKV